MTTQFVQKQNCFKNTKVTKKTKPNLTKLMFQKVVEFLPCVAKFTASKVFRTFPKFSPVYNHSGSKP